MEPHRQNQGASAAGRAVRVSTQRRVGSPCIFGTGLSFQPAQRSPNGSKFARGETCTHMCLKAAPNHYCTNCFLIPWMCFGAAWGCLPLWAFLARSLLCTPGHTHTLLFLPPWQKWENGIPAFLCAERGQSFAPLSARTSLPAAAGSARAKGQQCPRP